MIQKTLMMGVTTVSGFKVFAQDREGRLISCFEVARKPGLWYPPNQRIKVDDPDNTFFAFAEMKSALSVAVPGRREWNVAPGPLLVLPVTMHGIIFDGKFHVVSRDPQCLDAYYLAYESTEIEVHDSPEARTKFYGEIARADLRRQAYNWTPTMKEAYQHLMAEFCP